MDKSLYWVYILHCVNDTYYTGYTNDLAKRYQSHVDGTGQCKYTRSFKPTRIAQYWVINGDKALAMRVERLIKTLSRSQKVQLIAKPALLLKHLHPMLINPALAIAAAQPLLLPE
jgi:putative endonuclease